MPPPSHIAERIYYEEQDRLEFTAEVTEIRELSRVDGKPLFQIALNRTTFYPTSGGQPHDMGTLTATARSGAVLEAPVTDVSEDESGEVWHTTAKPLQSGTAIHARINAERRRDHMQQHSGQHLLSAIAAREFGVTTVGFHLGQESATVDLTMSMLTVEQMAHLQLLMNDAVAASLPVTQRTVSQEEAASLLASGALRKLPPREGAMRLVEIAGIDLNACGGTHVGNTAQIGPVLLRRTEKVRGNTRLTFFCGRRALAAASHDWQALSALAGTLSTSPEDVPARIAKMQEEIRAARKAARDAARTQPPQR